MSGRAARLLLTATALTLLSAALGAGVLSASRGSVGERGRGGVALKRIGSFDQPVYVTAAPGFPRLLFVVERTGRIKVVRRGRKLDRSFLNIAGLVNSLAEERGLLSLAFPPNYKRTKRFYVYYTDSQGDIRVDEFRRRTAVVAARGSRRTVMQIPHRANSNHNGGQLQFLGRLLYVGTGDGGAGNDPPDNAKSKRRLLGKLLRIDPRNPRGRRDYRVPRSNPFVGRRGRDEIFSYGLRNPWRFSFDTVSARRPRIVIADVGQDRFEEIDYEKLGGARGAHFGWDEWEAFAPHECDGRCARGTRKPIFAYGRSAGCTVIGGYVVRDPRLRSLRGRYVFTDLCEGRLRSIAPRLRRVRRARPVGVSVAEPTSFGEDRRGRVYVASLAGPVYRMVPR
jgi:glucose/arabinose dehydrogenase